MKRNEFVQLAINDPCKAAEILKKQAAELKNCKKTNQTVRRISKILFISERTIFRDCKK